MTACPAAHSAENDAPRTPARVRGVVEFAMLGDVRFLSHHDELRMLRRALVRAAWPIAYTQGFNPRPRLTIPFPRAVGVESTSEWATVDLDEARPVRELYDSLAAALPTACPLRRIAFPEGIDRPHACAVEYEVELTDSDVDATTARRDALLAADDCVIRRPGAPGRPEREIDIRRYIEVIDVTPTGLRMRLRLEGQQTARPTEVLAALQAHASRVRRVRVDWDTEIDGPNRWPPQDEGTNIGNQEEDDVSTARDAQA